MVPVPRLIFRASFSKRRPCPCCCPTVDPTLLRGHCLGWIDRKSNDLVSESHFLDGFVEVVLLISLDATAPASGRSFKSRD